MSPPEGLALEAGIVSPAAADLVVFYRDALGFALDATLSFPQGTVFRLRNGSARLKVFQPASGATPVHRPEPWHRDAGWSYAALHVADVAAAFDHAVTHGATAMVSPVSHRPGAVFAMVADPEGNVWELLEEAR